MSIRVIGLCGGSGSGKGTVGKILSQTGYLVLDTDKIYREMIEKPSRCLDALVCEFGGAILNDKGSLDRKRLSEIVFSDATKLKKLNEISHSYILAKVRENIINAEGEDYLGVIVDAPLLYESGFDAECDTVIAVVADRETRLGRIMQRDSISKEAAERRIDSQMADFQLEAMADFVISNNGTLEELAKRTLDVIAKL